MLPNVLQPDATDHIPVLAHELRRSLRIYKKGSKLDAFRWNRKLERNLLEDDDADELRQIVPRRP